MTKTSIKHLLLVICVAALLLALYLVFTTAPLNPINLLLIGIGAIGTLKFFTS